MLVCCCGAKTCQCLTYQAGSYQLDVHLAFPSVAHATRARCYRQADPTIWQTGAIGVRVPTTGKPRIIYLNTPTALASADFDSLGARPGVLFECQANIWTVIESNDFSILGHAVTAATSIVDGVAAVLPPGFTVPAPLDGVWCNPSYVPTSVVLTFANWTTVGLFRRANFNGVAMPLHLDSTTVISSRQVRQHRGTFYSDAPILCAGDPAYPEGTLRWAIRCETNEPATNDGTASQIGIVIGEDVVQGPDAHGCYPGFALSPSFTAAFFYLSTFDRLDDAPGLGHWIKRADITYLHPPFPDLTTLGAQTRTIEFQPSSPAIGDLLRCF